MMSTTPPMSTDNSISNHTGYGETETLQYSTLFEVPSSSNKEIHRHRHHGRKFPIVIVSVSAAVTLLIILVIILIIYVKKKRREFLERRRRRKEATKMFFEMNEFESTAAGCTDAFNVNTSTTRLNRYFVQNNANKSVMNSGQTRFINSVQDDISLS